MPFLIRLKIPILHDKINKKVAGFGKPGIVSSDVLALESETKIINFPYEHPSNLVKFCCICDQFYLLTETMLLWHFSVKSGPYTVKSCRIQ